MKCALIRCPQTLNIYVSAAYAVPPIGLCYVAGSLRKAGHDVVAIDPTGEGIERLIPIDETGQTVRHVQGQRALADVAGCWYRGPSGEPKRTSATVREKDIDQLAWPAWDLVPIENYLSGGHGWGVDRGRNMPMNATRGCPYQCTFCSS